MARTPREIAAELDHLIAGAPDPEALDLGRVHQLAKEFFALPSANNSDRLGSWFRLFERYPAFDGYGVFWSILHGLEKCPRYAAVAVKSARRRPTEFPVLMIQRMLNSGISAVSAADLRRVLRAVADNRAASATLRTDATEFLATLVNGGASITKP